MENPMQPPAPPPPPRRRTDTGNLHPPPPPQKCPRCDSSNTKFCYYNNYSLSQPRYFCKACRRYWTHGGTLRNVPVGGGTRRTRRPRPSAAAAPGGSRPVPPPAAPAAAMRAPIQPPMGSGSHFFTGGSFLPSFSAGVNPGVGIPDFGGVQYDVTSMALLQNFQSMQPPGSDDQRFPPQQVLNGNPGRPGGLNPNWAQSFMRSSSSAMSSSGFWSRAGTGEGENQEGPNPFNPNH